jgi:hypothetical protein
MTELFIGQKFTIDLGQIGPSTVTIKNIKNGVITFEHFNGKTFDMNEEEFRKEFKSEINL